MHSVNTSLYSGGILSNTYDDEYPLSFKLHAAADDLARAYGHGPKKLVKLRVQFSMLTLIPTLLYSLQEYVWLNI